MHKANGHLPKAADRSTAKAQDQLRGLLWGDLIIYLQKKRHGQSVIEELERLRVKHGQDRYWWRIPARFLQKLSGDTTWLTGRTPG